MLPFNNIISPQHISPKMIEGMISLKPNQLLMAKILEIFPDQSATILYNGATIHAKLEAPLTKGNRYLFEVAENKGTILLKKIDVDTIKSTTDQILQKLNVVSSDHMKKAVEFAVSEKIPLTKENVKQIGDLMQLTTGLPFTIKKEVIHRMLELQLAAHPDSVKAVANSLTKTTGQAEMVELYESLLPSAHKDKQIAKTVNLLQDLFGFQPKNSKLEQRSALSTTVNADGQMSKGEPSTSISNTKLVLQDGKHNSAFKHTTDDLIRTETLQTGKSDGSLNEVKRHPASSEFLQAVQKWLHKSGLLHERNLLFDPVQIKQTETLKSQLLLLQQSTQLLELPESVLQKVEQALLKITSQQIQNHPNNDGMQQFVLQIPFGQETNPKEITIHWEGRKQKGQSLDPNHCRMLFWLEMKSLKEVAVDVQIQNRIISLKVYSDYPNIEKLSGAFIPSLKKSLNVIHFTLSSISFTQKPQKEIGQKDTITSYKGMDLRV
ncbi:hypothetical protein KUV80_05585 [Fictibacillus nanhaiensis]|uniref:hypothetical protein n=1 Tax=Fictibacillus nanhaiensis TaxID=742169 RepID=UPI001C94F439|nr:hypothetical protein [Fictibacillus nanhaiensis]MBY6036111.1 hypothetical protein [Fictibacillus nanhaiensis]